MGVRRGDPVTVVLIGMLSSTKMDTGPDLVGLYSGSVREEIYAV